VLIFPLEEYIAKLFRTDPAEIETESSKVLTVSIAIIRIVFEILSYGVAIYVGLLLTEALLHDELYLNVLDVAGVSRSSISLVLPQSCPLDSSS
jgi:hypothetical protein